MPTHEELIQAVSRAFLFSFLGHEFSGLADVAPLDVIGTGCHMWVPGHALCPGPPLEESAAGPGWEQDDLCWSLSFCFPSQRIPQHMQLKAQGKCPPCAAFL